MRRPFRRVYRWAAAWLLILGLVVLLDVLFDGSSAVGRGLVEGAILATFIVGLLASPFGRR
jgi:hypothetical protein